MNLYDTPDDILVTAEGSLRVVTLNRPGDMNASTTKMLFALPHVLESLALDHDARVVLLTGAGRAFSAGADMNHFVKTLDDPVFARDTLENARRTIRGFVDLPIPIIAAVNGPAVGFGATIATLCDIVLLSDRAWISEPHVNLGMVVGDGIAVSWPLYTSLLRAKELIFTGEKITAQTAVEMGLANRVVPHDDLMSEARTLAGKLLAQPAAALRETKKLMNLYLRNATTAVLDAQLNAQINAILGEEHHRLAQAFLDSQKRKQGQP
jgi:enoyl-CoA hydratase/carnithine racemase